MCTAAQSISSAAPVGLRARYMHMYMYAPPGPAFGAWQHEQVSDDERNSEAGHEWSEGAAKSVLCDQPRKRDHANGSMLRRKPLARQLRPPVRVLGPRAEAKRFERWDRPAADERHAPLDSPSPGDSQQPQVEPSPLDLAKCLTRTPGDWSSHYIIGFRGFRRASLCLSRCARDPTSRDAGQLPRNPGGGACPSGGGVVALTDQSPLKCHKTSVSVASISVRV